MCKLVSYLAENSELVTAWTAIIAVLLSIVSIVFTLWTVLMQRKHNRKSVMPIAQFVFGDYENEIAVRLFNYGVGPLIVDKLEVRKGGDVRWNTLIECMPSLPEGCHWTSFVEDISGRAIPANGQIPLVVLKGDDADSNFVAARQKIRGALADLVISIRYLDVYRKKLPIVTRSLSWFGRNASKSAA